MRFRERHRDDRSGSGGGSPEPGRGLDNLRQAARDALRAGDDAIDRALSHGRSEAFLAANRQEGGQ